MKTAMPAGLMSALQARAPSFTANGQPTVKMKLKPGDSKLMSNQINRTAPAQAAPPPMIEKDPFGKFGSMNWADAMGRAMARDDMEKAARAEELEQIGIAAGETIPKIAGIGASALALAKAHPGAAIGGGLGALHGLMNGGLGSAVVEGGVGAGVGAGAQYGLGKAMEHPDYGGKLRAAKEQLMAKMRGGAPPAPPGATLLGVAPQKTIMGVAPPAAKVAAMRDEIAKIAEEEKAAFGAALAGAARAAIPAITNFVKTNPLKAGLGAASAIGNFASARKNGEGLGSALISGASGAASAL